MNIKKLAVLCASTSAFVCSGQALAQEAPVSVSQEQSDEILVTARRVEERAQDVPISITAISAKDVRELNIRDVSDITSMAPNLIFQNVSNSVSALAVTMRGVTPNNDVTLATDQPVGIYVDDFNIPRPFGIRSALIDVDRIEVLRGPQGTLFGRNTTGGAISIHTADPTNELEGNVSLAYGNYDLLRLTGVLNVPLSNAVQFRGVFQRATRDGYGRDAAGHELMKEDSWYGRGKLKLAIGERVEVVLSGSYNTDNAGGNIWNIRNFTPTFVAEVAAELFGLGVFSPTNPNAGQQFATATATLQGFIQPSDFFSYATLTPLAEFEAGNAGADVKVELSDYLTLRSLTGWSTFNRRDVDDADGTPFTAITPDNRTNNNFYSQELQLLGGDEKLNWVVGGYYSKETGKETSITVALPALNPRNPSIITGDFVSTTLAGFAQANWQVTDALSVTGGLRYSSDRRSVAADNRAAGVCNVPAPGAAASPPSQCPRTFKSKFGAWNWLASVDYKIAPDVLVFSKVSTGYRAGGRNFRGSVLIESFAEFGPERVTSHEVGLKSDLFNRVLRLNLAAFYDKYKGLQRSIGVLTPTGTIATALLNAADARVYGLEAEAALRITPELSLHGTGSYTNAKYAKGSFRNPATGADLSDARFQIPEWTATGAVRYDAPTSFGRISGNVEYVWRSEISNAPIVDVQFRELYVERPIGLLNARVAADFERLGLEVAVSGRNIANTRYFGGAASLDGVLGFGSTFPGEPRTYAIEVTKRF